MNEILIIAIIFFVLIHLISGVFNILIAQNMKKIAKGQSEMRDEELVLQSAQWESINIKFSDIMEKLAILEKGDFMTNASLEALQEDIFDEYIKNSGVKKTRGPYKPRKPKELDHKKTPPEF